MGVGFYRRVDKPVSGVEDQHACLRNPARTRRSRRANRTPTVPMLVRAKFPKQGPRQPPRLRFSCNTTARAVRMQYVHAELAEDKTEIGRASRMWQAADGVYIVSACLFVPPAQASFVTGGRFLGSVSVDVRRCSDNSAGQFKERNRMH